MLRRMPRPSPALVVALIALVVAATGGAMAAIPDADGTIHGCIGARGALRVIEPPATCEATEAALDFSQKGPAGERGPAGPPGSRLTAEETAVIDAGAELSTKAPKPGKLKLSRKQLAELAPEKKSEAFSAYRDGPVTLGPYKGAKSGVVASLPLPAGRWVIFAKAWVNSNFANCDLQAGTDSDRTLAYAGNTLHANVVHRFTKAQPGAVQVRCTGRDHSHDQGHGDRGRRAHEHAHELLTANRAGPGGEIAAILAVGL